MIDQLLRQLCEAIASLALPERIEALNRVRQTLTTVSPFAGEPVDCVEWVPADRVAGNEYNPNRVAKPEMELLYQSIKSDGYTQPIVSFTDGDRRVVVDGFHRNRVGKEKPDIRERLHGYLPLVSIKKSIDERMASTIRHNRARGKHSVEPMGDLVRRLCAMNVTDEEISRRLGMEGEEVLRLRQLSKAARVLSAQQYGRTWELTEDGKK